MDDTGFPTFQEMVKNDLADVFFNPENLEFCTKVDIDGEKVSIAIDTERLNERNIKDSIENVSLVSLSFFVPINILGYKPHIGYQMQFDRNLYTVADVKEYFGGVLEIVLFSYNGM